jgi:hypothetical protein
MRSYQFRYVLVKVPISKLCSYLSSASSSECQNSSPEYDTTTFNLSFQFDDRQHLRLRCYLFKYGNHK